MAAWIDRRRIRSGAFGALAITIVLFSAAERASAHALLVEAIPAEAATLETSPPQLVLRFNSRIEHKLSRATLSLGEDGEPRALEVDPAAGPDRFVAPLPPPSTPARACIATRAILLSGCWTVKETPAVCV